MARDVIVRLETLHCNREGDVSGHSEPYIWPVLMWVDDHTLATSQLVGSTATGNGQARVVIQNDMSAGQTANIPDAVNVLRLRLDDGLSRQQLILTVALWEEDETPDASVHAGYFAFGSELRAAVADNLLALNQAAGPALDELVNEIKGRVKGKVESAISDGLTDWQKARVLLGTLNLDDIVDSAFLSIPTIAPTPITLTFGAGTSNDYEIRGRLEVVPLNADPCQFQIDSVKSAKAAVDSIDQDIRQLRAELDELIELHAPLAQRNAVRAEIRRLRDQVLPPAMEALENARRSLEICRAGH